MRYLQGPGATSVRIALVALAVTSCAPSVDRIPEVTSGMAHACALRADGALYCWGANGTGQLGQGSMSGTTQTAVRVGGSVAWSRVTSGHDFTCALQRDASLWCWGANLTGVIEGGAASHSTPTRISGTSDWIAIAAGGAHLCGLHADHSIECWRGLTRNAPHSTFSGDWTEVSVNWYQVCAIARDGSLSCADAPSPDDPSASWSMVRVGSETQWAHVGVGVQHACATRADGSLWCWGLFETASGRRSVPMPERVGSENDWSGLIAAGYHTCAGRLDGSLWCWGRTMDGQLGPDVTAFASAPVRMPLTTRVTAATAAGFHTCALADDGVVRCWGGDEGNVLGRGPGASDLSVPMPVLGPPGTPLSR